MQSKDQNYTHSESNACFLTEPGEQAEYSKWDWKEFHYCPIEDNCNMKLKLTA